MRNRESLRHFRALPRTVDTTNLNRQRYRTLSKHMVKNYAKLFGVILLALGALGIFSNAFVGTTGFFVANTGLSVINLVFGMMLLALSGTEEGAEAWLKIIGVAYALIGGIVMFIAGFAETRNIHTVPAHARTTQNV
jgi:membrane-bound ClpP family serine protease